MGHPSDRAVYRLLAQMGLPPAPGALALALVGCGGGAAQTPPERETAPAVCVCVSVDWEGAYLAAEDLAALAGWTEAAPGVPLTHLLNAAYYTKEDADAAGTSAAIRGVLREMDETGLHVHAWNSLAERAGVVALEAPSFLGEEALELDGDAGYDIRLESYEVDEIRAFVATSRRILEGQGFKLSRSFRAGGWQAGPRVLEAIRAEGFDIDTSAMDAGWLDEIEELPIQADIRALWPDVEAHTQPFFVTTAAGPVLEMPDTGSLADYASADEMLAHIGQALERAEADEASGARGGRTRFVHLGFHLEGAADYAPRVAQALRRARALHPGERMVFETLESCAARAAAGLREAGR